MGGLFCEDNTQSKHLEGGVLSLQSSQVGEGPDAEEKKGFESLVIRKEKLRNVEAAGTGDRRSR